MQSELLARCGVDFGLDIAEISSRIFGDASGRRKLKLCSFESLLYGGNVKGRAALKHLC